MSWYERMRGLFVEKSSLSLCDSLHTHPSAFVEADVDGALEEDKVALGELERLELRPQRVALVRCLKVLEQVRVDGAPERNRERLNE